MRPVRHGKPVIGIAGGIASGKSYIADLFGELGCLVIKSDDQVAAAYRDPEVLAELKRWWGDGVVRPDGAVDKRVIANRIFGDPEERRRLEGLLHPYVARLRDTQMLAAAGDKNVVAYVWDTPLLFETGLNQECDAVVFVDAPRDLRVSRVKETRGWDESELMRREILQTPLDRKRELSDHVITNTADATRARSQVREVLSRILVEKTGRAALG
jgi:dephospho-CoA kinase